MNKFLYPYFRPLQNFRFLCWGIFCLITFTANGQTGAPEINVKRGSADRATGTTHSFGDQNVNTSGSNLNFTIYNEGSGNLTIANIALSGVNADQFKLNKTQTKTLVAPGETTTFSIAFAPTSISPELKNAALTINNNDSNEGAYTINLTGKAVLLAPNINASSGISPPAGAVAAAIIITGTNLINTDSVFFAGANSTRIAAVFTINSDTKITATVPVKAITGVITVKNVSGTNVSSEIFTFLETYTWNKTSGNWAEPDSWTPARITPATTDILVFNGLNSVSTATMTATVNFASPQTVAQIKLINNANVTFTVAEDKTLNIGINASDADFLVAAGCSLRVTNSASEADLTINITSGETGTVVGTVTFQAGTTTSVATHRLLASAGGLNFTSSGKFIASPMLSGSPFGTTNLGSVTFSSGSAYTNQSGSSPFGAASPDAVVIFNSGSTYSHEINSAPDLINRTYGNFTINNTAFNQTITGSGNLIIRNTFTQTNAATFNLNLVGTITIGRSVNVTRGSLNFSPASAATIRLDGSGVTTNAGTVSGGTTTSNTINFGANSNLIIETPAIISITKSITTTGKVTVNGTVRTNLANGLVGTGAAFNTSQPLTLNPGSTVDYYSPPTPIDQTISSLDYANLTISGNSSASRGGTTVTFPAIVRVAGQFTLDADGNSVNYNTTTNNSTIEFNGGEQSIPAFSYNNLTVSGTGDKLLEESFIVNRELKMVANKIDTNGNFLILGDNATITGEDTGIYVVGNLSATRNITSSGSNFGGMGISIVPGPSGSPNMGSTTVTRIAGPGSSVQVEDRQGINRRWEVTPTTPPASPVNVTLSWLADDDNDGINELERDLTAMRVWKTNGDDESKYYDVSKTDQNASNRTITATVSSFSTLTVSDKVNPLPVELLSFNVAKNGNNAVLTWQTASEKNNLGFAVEISSDAKIFQEIGFVKSLNSNSMALQNYTFTHRAVEAGTVYYRLKQTDWNGVTKYYGPKAIRFDQVAAGLLVYPNPVNNKEAEVTIEVAGINKENASITVTDIFGKIVYHRTKAINPAQNQLKVDLSRQPAGVYIISVATSTGTSQARIVKH